MKVEQNFDGVRDELTIMLRLPISEIAKMTGAIQSTIQDMLIAQILSALDLESIKTEVTKGVINEMCKQAAERFIEENGDEIVEDAREALEDMLEEIS